MRQVGVALVVVAVFLAVWAGWLSGALDPAEHRWHWVGLDVIQVVALLGTGVLLVRDRRRPAALAALLSAPLFLYDACQDVVTSHVSTPDLLMALAMALCAELPMALVLLWVAARCLRRTP